MSAVETLNLDVAKDVALSLDGGMKDIELDVATPITIASLDIESTPDVALSLGESAPSLVLDVGEAGTSGDYSQLINKPSIEGHVLIGNSELPDIGVRDVTPQLIDDIVFGG